VTNLPTIPQTTASLYMRLAKNKSLIDKQRVANAIDEGKLSCRAAAKLIPPSEEAKAAAAKRKETREANKALADANQLEDLLQALAVDEVYTALKNTQPVDYLLELAQLIRQGNEKRDGLNIPTNLPPSPQPPSPPPTSLKPVERRNLE